MKNKNDEMELDGRLLNHVKVGAYVEVVKKADQATGTLTDGVVKRILTKSRKHPHGIKVMLDTGEVGRVKIIHDED